VADFLAVPAPVDLLLERACYDCHSAETRWPWDARIAPISWLLVDHVQHGRSNLDFSSWSTDQDREPTPPQRLEWICRQTRDGTMPPRLYRLMHRAARLTSEEQDRLCRWTEAALSLVDGTSVEAEDTT
jgi:hypothetical protein